MKFVELSVSFELPFLLVSQYPSLTVSIQTPFSPVREESHLVFEMDDLSIGNTQDLEEKIDLEALTPHVPDEQMDDINKRPEVEIVPVVDTVSFSVKAYTVSYE